MPAFKTISQDRQVGEGLVIVPRPSPPAAFRPMPSGRSSPFIPFSTPVSSPPSSTMSGRIVVPFLLQIPWSSFPPSRRGHIILILSPTVIMPIQFIRPLLVAPGPWRMVFIIPFIIIVIIIIFPVPQFPKRTGHGHHQQTEHQQEVKNEYDNATDAAVPHKDEQDIPEYEKDRSSYCQGYEREYRYLGNQRERHLQKPSPFSRIVGMNGIHI